MKKKQALIALVAFAALALSTGCDQSTDSGSKWICEAYQPTESTELLNQNWTCESQQAYNECRFKTVCDDADQQQWFCSNVDDRPYASQCQGSYICVDQAEHLWACDTSAGQANCEENYFDQGTNLYFCNAAFNVYTDPPIFWECPAEATPYPKAQEGFACPRLGARPRPCGAECQQNYEKEIPEGCTRLQFVGNGQCLPLWSLTTGVAINYCNLVSAVQCTLD